jgi:hypothetical protein
VRADVSTLTWGGLVDEYLEDEATTRLATFIDRQLQLAWWDVTTDE